MFGEPRRLGTASDEYEVLTRRRSCAGTDILQDLELWHSEGDCLVHYYTLGHSGRGPSLKLPLAAIETLGCERLLEDHGRKQDSCSSASNASQSSPTSSISSRASFDASGVNHELYIPAPANLSREDAFKYHLTTRNFFAWALGKPLVGDSLGSSLIDLLERINKYRSDQKENLEDVVSYIDSQEYSDFRECPDHALAVLQFAERFELQDLWTDAFVHCVGMYNELASSGEYEVSSSVLCRDVRQRVDIVTSRFRELQRHSLPGLILKWIYG